MNWYKPAFVVVYLVTMFCYFFSETSGNFKRRVVNKIILASLFLLYFLIAFNKNYNAASFHFIAVTAFIFAWLGDVFLLFSFFKGGIMFMVSNILFFIYQILLCGVLGLTFNRIWWFLLIFSACWGLFLLLYKKGWLKIPMKIFIFYIATVTLHGSMGIAMAVAYPSLKIALFGIGLGLFMVSDYFLTLHAFKYKESKSILRLNSGTYFTGMLLAALSFSI